MKSSKSKSKLSIFLLSCLLLFSCSNKQTTAVDNSLLDSLANRCFDLVNELQTDSLRITAELYMKAAAPESKQFYKARQYYINSYFNARDYDKVLSLLASTEQMPSFNKYPETVCDYMYTRARALQYSKRYPEAIEAFKYCLNFVPKEEAKYEALLPTMLSAMTQLMNTYCGSGNVQNGYLYFSEMKSNPSPVIRRFVLRDLYSHLGYLAIQDGHSEEAYRITDSVFVLPLHNPTPEKLFRDYSYAAVVFYNNANAKQRIVQWLEQAIEEADKCGYTSGLEWSLSFLSEIYWQQKNIEKGIELQYKALYLAQKRKDKKAESYIYGDLSRLYNDWELYQQSNEFANHSIEIALPIDNSEIISRAYISKAKVMQLMDIQDSAIIYYKKAEEYANKAQFSMLHKWAITSIAQLLVDNHEGDSLAQGVRMIQDVLKETSQNEEKNQYFYILGKGLIKQGNKIKGEVMLDSMYAATNRMQGKYAEGVLEYVIDHYLAEKNHAKVAQYTSIYRKQVKNHFDEKISRKITSAMVQFQTEKKEQQLKLATSELKMKNLKIRLFIIILILLIFVLIISFLWYLHERKLQKERNLLIEQEKLIALRERELAETCLQEQKQKLADALENLRDANLQSEQVQEKLNDFLNDRENKQNITAITPSIFREKGEVKFRRYFTQLYPDFINTLKTYIPDITRGEEVLCMLIALNQNIDEVADILCIEKKSVKMSRYRLRKKTGLKQEESLDDFISHLL